VSFILQGSGSLMFSLSSLINSVFADFSKSSVVADGNLQHLLNNCSGKSFTDDVNCQKIERIKKSFKRVYFNLLSMSIKTM